MPGSDLASVMDTQLAVVPAAHQASLVGRVLDARNFRRVIFHQQCGVVSGTNPTWDGKIQASPPPAETVDCQQMTPGTTENILRDGAASNLELAAAFTTGAGGNTIREIKLMLKKIGTVVSGKILTLEIQGDTAGDPDGTAVQTADTVQTDDIGSSFALVTFTFKDPIDLTAATKYHAVLGGDYATSATNAIVWRSFTVASGGNLSYYDAAWAQTATEDLEIQGLELVFADVSGATFTQITASNPDAEEVSVDRKTVEPYLRYVGTIGGTATPTFNLSSVSIGGEKKVLP
jgi:hypothetical protein